MKAAQARDADRATIGPLQIGIILLTLATAFIHLVVLNMMMGQIDVLFTLNGLGYLALLAALYLPVPFAKDNRSLVRIVFIGYTVLSILAWVFLGQPSDLLGYVTKAIELALIVLLIVEARR